MSGLTFVRLGHGVIHYSDRGPKAATALVFANSLGTDLRVWQAVADHFAPRYRILQYDKRGHGLSALSPGGWSVPALAGDLAELMEERAITSAVVLGLSVGGMIAQSLAAARPDLVRALVLSNTGHKIGTQEAWQQRIDGVRAGGIASLADAVMERWFSTAFRNAHPAELAGWRAMLTRTEMEGYIGTCQAIRDADLTASTRGLTQPTLCIAGGADGATPPALVRELAGLIQGAKLVEIPGVGHLPCVEKPDSVIEAVEDFLKELGL